MVLDSDPFVGGSFFSIYDNLDTRRSFSLARTTWIGPATKDIRHFRGATDQRSPVKLCVVYAQYKLFLASIHFTARMCRSFLTQ